MRKEFLSYLICPETSESFTITAYETQGEHIISGLLESKSSWYPIIKGIPRILLKELKVNSLQTHHDFLKQFGNKLPAGVKKEWQAAIDRIQDMDRFLAHQKRTAESFSYEWKYIYKENDYEKQNFLHFLSPYIKEKDLKGKETLDIGCGSGRFTKWAAKLGTKVSFGTDLGETVEIAYEMTKDLPNVCIVQADIYDMPFKGVFDIAYSIGVLHHLPQPQYGFSRLPKVLKHSGQMLIWVYNRRGNARALYFYEPLRSLLKQLPKPLLFRLCYIPGFGVHLINLVTVGLEKLGLRKLAAKMPFYYYKNFPFNMKLNDAFDVLATPKSNYYYKEEVENWFETSGLRHIQAYEHPEAGITCVGEYGGEPPKKRTIVHLIQALNTGGSENVLLKTLPRMSQEYEHRIITLREPGELAKRFREMGIKVINLSSNGWIDLIFGQRLARLVKTQQPELVITHLFHADLVGRLALQKRISAPVIPSLVTTYNFSRYWPARLFEKLTHRWARHYFANSEAVKEFYVSNIGVSPEKITVIPNGVDVALYEDASGKQVREELKLPEPRMIITCVANLAVNKGHAYLLEAYEAIASKHPESNLLLVGTGPEKENLLQQIETYKSKSRIKFLGRRNDVPSILAITDIFVLPTMFEGMSNAILEAMAAGCAIVTTDIPENRVMIEHDKTGLLVPLRDSKAIQNAVTTLLENKPKCQTLGKNAKAFVKSHFDLQAVAKQMDEAIKQFV